MSQRGPSAVSVMQQCQPLTDNPHAALPPPDRDSYTSSSKVIVPSSFAFAVASTSSLLDSRMAQMSPELSYTDLSVLLDSTSQCERPRYGTGCGYWECGKHLHINGFPHGFTSPSTRNLRGGS